MKPGVTLVVSRQLGLYYEAALVHGDQQAVVRHAWERSTMAAWVAEFAAFTGHATAWCDDRVGAAWAITDGPDAPIAPIAAAKSPIYGIEAIGYAEHGRGNATELVKGTGEVLPLGHVWNRDLAGRYLDAWRAITGYGGLFSEGRYFPESVIDERDRRRIFGAARTMGVAPEQLRAAIHERFAVESTNQLTKRQCNLVIFELIPGIAAGTLPPGHPDVPTMPLEAPGGGAEAAPAAPGPQEAAIADDDFNAMPIKKPKPAKKPKKDVS